MTLYIDTTDNKEIVLQLFKSSTLISELRLPAERRQAEELLPGIERLLEQVGCKLSDLEKIKVNNAGGSFTSLRIGVVTANALAYALGLPIEGNEPADTKQEGDVNVVVPKYSSDPQITIKKKVI